MIDWLAANGFDLVTLLVLAAAYGELRAKVGGLRRDVDNDKTGRKAVADQATTIAGLVEICHGLQDSVAGLQQTAEQLSQRLAAVSEQGAVNTVAQAQTEAAIARVHARLDDFAHSGVMAARRQMSAALRPPPGPGASA